MTGPRHPDLKAASPQAAAEPVRVLAAVIRRDGRYLVCQRPAHKRHGGSWEFPGGKIHAGESLLDAARRELAEELSLEVVQVGSVLFAGSDVGSEFIIEFVEVVVAGEPVALEHDQVRWLTHSEILALEMAPADRALAATVSADMNAHLEFVLTGGDIA
ncbi:MAG: (deoxy)nucleoside triphosphate pyrophosphohydrolase [Longimicrobiales bacterium]